MGAGFHITTAIARLVPAQGTAHDDERAIVIDPATVTAVAVGAAAAGATEPVSFSLKVLFVMESVPVLYIPPPAPLGPLPIPWPVVFPCRILFVIESVP